MLRLLHECEPGFTIKSKDHGLNICESKFHSVYSLFVFTYKLDHPKSFPHDLHYANKTNHGSIYIFHERCNSTTEKVLFS